jgi:hypothetical protein
MNIIIHYLYRDSGNWKDFGEVVFKNRRGLSVDFVLSELKRYCESKDFFIAEQVGFDELWSGFDQETDHGWHEISDVESTDEAATDERDICEVLEAFAKAAKEGWSVCPTRMTTKMLDESQRSLIIQALTEYAAAGRAGSDNASSLVKDIGDQAIFVTYDY